MAMKHQSYVNFKFQSRLSNKMNYILTGEYIWKSTNQDSWMKKTHIALGILPGSEKWTLWHKMTAKGSYFTVGAASLCYWEELMLLKLELMLLKCQINTNTHKNGFLLPTKCLFRNTHTKFQYFKFFYCLRIFKFKFKFVIFTTTLNYVWVFQNPF